MDLSSFGFIQKENAINFESVYDLSCLVVMTSFNFIFLNFCTVISNLKFVPYFDILQKFVQNVRNTEKKSFYPEQCAIYKMAYHRNTHKRSLSQEITTVGHVSIAK